MYPAINSDIEEARRVLGAEPQRAAGAVFGSTAWARLGRYFDLRDSPATIPSNIGGRIPIARDPTMKPEDARWYYLESNFQAHLSRL